MNKKELINGLRTLLWENYNQDGYYPFHNFLVFHYDYGKYTLMSLYIDEDTDKLSVESVGYSGFGLYYFDLEKLNYKTIKAIKDKVELNLKNITL